jgi:hypothetical protein
MAVCDICNKELANLEGFLLTTEQVVTTPAYWQKTFSGPMGGLLAAAAGSEQAFKAQIANQMASQRSPWMICERCIDLFSIDRQKAKDYAQRWYQSAGVFAPPGSGAVPLSKVNMGDGKAYIQGGSPEAERLAAGLKSASTPPKQSSCFIATAAFSPSAEEVVHLRRYRDQKLACSKIGVRLVSLYYVASPPIARWIQRSPARREGARYILTPIVKLTKKSLQHGMNN